MKVTEGFEIILFLVQFLLLIQFQKKKQPPVHIILLLTHLGCFFGRQIVYAQTQNTQQLIDSLRRHPLTACLFLFSSQLPLRVNITSHKKKCHLSSPEVGQKQFGSKQGKYFQHGAFHQAKFSKMASGESVQSDRFRDETKTLLCYFYIRHC